MNDKPINDAFDSEDEIPKRDKVTSRRKTRELALGAMYEIEAGKHDPEVVIARTIESQGISVAAAEFFSASIRLAWEYRELSDRVISELSEGWKIDRIARIDLAILRLTIVELLIGLEDPTPPDPVIINEAVVLAKKFSTADSGKFINGILATIVKNKQKFQSMLKP